MTNFDFIQTRHVEAIDIDASTQAEVDAFLDGTGFNLRRGGGILVNIVHTGTNVYQGGITRYDVLDHELLVKVDGVITEAVSYTNFFASYAKQEMAKRYEEDMRIVRESRARRAQRRAQQAIRNTAPSA
jgi:hypothetical protein